MFFDGYKDRCKRLISGKFRDLQIHYTVLTLTWRNLAGNSQNSTPDYYKRNLLSKLIKIRVICYNSNVKSSSNICVLNVKKFSGKSFPFAMFYSSTRGDVENKEKKDKCGMFGGKGRQSDNTTFSFQV